MNDLFHTEQTAVKIRSNNINAEFKEINDMQFVRFHINYNFGKQTVEQTRRRRTGAEDEQNKVKTSK